MSEPIQSIHCTDHRCAESCRVYSKELSGVQQRRPGLYVKATFGGKTIACKSSNIYKVMLRMPGCHFTVVGTSLGSNPLIEHTHEACLPPWGLILRNGLKFAPAGVCAIHIVTFALAGSKSHSMIRTQLRLGNSHNYETRILFYGNGEKGDPSLNHKTTRGPNVPVPFGHMRCELLT